MAMLRPASDVDQTMRGELRKQSPHIGVFRRRHVVLNALGMSIYPLSNGEADKPNSIVPITADTTVSEVKLTTIRGGHGTSHTQQAVFQVFPFANQSPNPTSYRPRIFGSSSDEHWFAASSMELALKWKAAIEERAKALAAQRANLEQKQQQQGQTANGGGTSTPSMTSFTESQKRLIGTESFTSLTRDEKMRNLRERLKRTNTMKLPQVNPAVNSTINLLQQAQWREVLVTNGLRIMGEMSKDNPCLRISCVLPASPERALNLYYNFERRSEWDTLTESVRLLSSDEGSPLKTMHCKLRGIKVGGLWFAPRDFVVDSIWRQDDDGSIVIIETSSKEQNVPPQPGYVRAEIFALGMTLCPRKRKTKAGTDTNADESMNPGSSSPDCLLQMAVNADVGGWLAKMPLQWGQHWLFSFMLRVIAFKQVLEEENYESVDVQNIKPVAEKPKPIHDDFAAGLSHFPSSTPLSRDAKVLPASAKKESEIKPLAIPQVEGTLPKDHVYNCDEPWHVRSKLYLEDRKKEPSSGTMFELIAMDLWEMDQPIDNVGANMKGGLADKYLSTPGPKPYLFIIQFQIPGPPFLAFIAYFAARPGVMEEVSPFSRLLADFIEGTDTFRDSRFKFIPRVVKGSYIVKSAVGQTPAILGQKLVCNYFKGDGYFEIDVDVASSSVAGGVLKIVKGYITALVIDMCFLLEGQTTDELPEAVLGSLRFERLSLNMAKKWPPTE